MSRLLIDKSRDMITVGGGHLNMDAVNTRGLFTTHSGHFTIHLDAAISVPKSPQGNRFRCQPVSGYFGETGSKNIAVKALS